MNKLRRKTIRPAHLFFRTRTPHPLTEISFWDESGFRADAVPGKTGGVRAHTPVAQVPGQRQGISAASAISANGASWFATYAGALTRPLFVDLLHRMMRGRRKPLHLDP